MLITEEVNFIGFWENQTLVSDVEFFLSLERDSLLLKLYSKRFLINRFQKSTTQNLVYLHARAHYLVALVFEKEILIVPHKKLGFNPNHIYST
jgi:hypothetical protein